MFFYLGFTGPHLIGRWLLEESHREYLFSGQKMFHAYIPAAIGVPFNNSEDLVQLKCSNGHIRKLYRDKILLEKYSPFVTACVFPSFGGMALFGYISTFADRSAGDIL